MDIPPANVENIYSVKLSFSSHLESRVQTSVSGFTSPDSHISSQETRKVDHASIQPPFHSILRVSSRAGYRGRPVGPDPKSPSVPLISRLGDKKRGRPTDSQLVIGI